MRFKVILCVALLALIAFGGLRGPQAKPSRAPNTIKWGHTWQGDCVETVLLMLTGSSITPLQIYIVSFPQTTDEGLGQERGIPKGHKGKKGRKDVGADKNLRRRGQTEALRD